MNSPGIISFVFDLSLLIIVGYYIVSGARKGTLHTLFSLVALVIAYPLACLLFPWFASLFPKRVEARILGDTVAFATTIGVFYWLTVLSMWVVHVTIKRFYRDISDYLAGALMGLFRGIVILVFVIMLVITLLPINSSLIKKSLLSRSAISLVSFLSSPLPVHLKNIFVRKKEGLERQWIKHTHSP